MEIPAPSPPGSLRASLGGTEAVGEGGYRERVTAGLCVCGSTAGVRGDWCGCGDGRTGGVGGRGPGGAPVSGSGGSRGWGRVWWRVCHVTLAGHATGAAPPPGVARAPLGLPRPSSTLSGFARRGLGPSRHCSGLSCGAQVFLSSLVPASGTLGSLRPLSDLSGCARCSSSFLGPASAVLGCLR